MKFNSFNYLKYYLISDFELWFRQIVVEVDSVRRLLCDSGQLATCVDRVRRVTNLIQVCAAAGRRREGIGWVRLGWVGLGWVELGCFQARGIMFGIFVLFSPC